MYRLNHTTIPGVFLISGASRIKNGSDRTGPPRPATVLLQQRSCAEYPVDCAFWREALHIKQACLSVSAQAAATKSNSPAFSRLRILALEFCKGRLTPKTKNQAPDVIPLFVLQTGRGRKVWITKKKVLSDKVYKFTSMAFNELLF